MIERRILSEEHQAIAAIASALLVLSVRHDSDVIAIIKLRWRLAHALAGHLAKEDKIIYSALKAHPDAGVALLAARFAQEMGNLSERYRDYMDAWNADGISFYRSAFESETRKVIAALRRRIAKEEADLYRLYERSDAIRRSSATATSAVIL